MKKRYVLGKGYLKTLNNNVGLYTGNFTPVVLNVPRKDFWCNCKGKCKCLKIRLVVEKIND